MNTSSWSKDRIIGQKRPFQISRIWIVKLKVSDAAYGNYVSSRATVLQQKTGKYTKCCSIQACGYDHAIAVKFKIMYNFPDP